jgi:hypothetical protein
MIEGDVSLGQYMRTMGMNSPFGAPYAFQDASEIRAMARGNDARIMNVFAEAGGSYVKRISSGPL